MKTQETTNGKKVNIELFAGKTQIKKSIVLHSNTGFNKVLGTCINSIFQFNERLKKYGSSYIKATDAISVTISTEDNILLDSYKLNSEYGFTLKFGSSAKSKRKFATCLNDLVTWAAEDVKPMTLEEVIKNLED